MWRSIKGRFPSFLAVSGKRLNLRPIFMALTAMLFVASAIAVSWSVRTLAEVIIEQWATRFITKQALYDKSRTIQPILREVALSRQLATAQFIRDWARNPEDPALTKNALRELETYRQNFQDRSYFIAFLNTGRYYHNNADNEYANNEFRYILDPDKKADSWFYDLIKQKRDIHINVNPDVELGITKLWIDVLIRDGNDILGIAGTGLDLTEFLNNVVEESEPGITSLFVDHTGAIQLHRDKTLIDFGSISKEQRAHKTIDLIFSESDDRRNIYAAMKTLEVGKKNVATTFVDVNGHRHLAGILYLPEIDWHEITLIDLDVLLPLSQFSTILFAYIATLLGALILFNFSLNRLVLNPLNRLDLAMDQVEKGRNPASVIKNGGPGEVGRLIRHFMQMAQTVLASRRDLEEKVRDRTAALERLAKVDPLTELLNRRGMTERMEMNLNKARREDSTVGILWIDVDAFKEINDTHGHAVGDDALKAVAQIIQTSIRPYDLAARWGGDEFLVLLHPADSVTLARIGERLRSEVAAHQGLVENVSLTVSIGGCLSTDNQRIDSLLQNADQALYEAKTNGRNRFFAYQYA